MEIEVLLPSGEKGRLRGRKRIPLTLVLSP